MERFHTITIGGESYRLRLSIHATRAAQQASGKPLGHLMSSLIALDTDAMSVLLYAALLAEKPAIKRAEADALLQQWIDEGADLEQVSVDLMKTLQAAGLIKVRETASADAANQDDADPEGKAPAPPSTTG